MNTVTNNLSLINNKRITNSGKLKRKNFLGLGFVSLIAACGGAEEGSTALTGDGGVSEDDIQARIDAAVATAVRKEEARVRNLIEIEADKAEQDRIDAENARLAEEATYTPTSEFTGITAISVTGGDSFSNIRVSWSEPGYVTNIPVEEANFYMPDTTPENSVAAGRAGVHNLGGGAKADLLVTLPTFSHNDCDKEKAGLVAVYWDIQYGFDLNSKHLRILGASRDDAIGDEGVSFYHIGGLTNFNQLDMIVSSSLVDNGGEVDAGAIYIIWDFDRYNGESTTIDLATDTGSRSNILAIRGGYDNNHIGNSKKTIAKVNNDLINNVDIVDLILEVPDAAGGKGGLFIIWDIAKQEYRNGKDINLHQDAPGIFKIYGKNTTNNLGEDGSGRGFIFKESSTSNKIMLRDFDHKGTHDLVFYDGEYTYLLLGERFMGSNEFVNLALTVYRPGTVSDSGGSGGITLFRVGSDGGYHYKVAGQYTDVTTFYSEIVGDTKASSPIQRAWAGARFAGTPFGNNQAKDKISTPISEESTAIPSTSLTDVQEDGIWDIA